MTVPEHPDLAHVGALVTAAVRDGGVPGAVTTVGRGPVTLGQWAAGQADTTRGQRRPVHPGTVFDLASLTKVVATTTVVLALAARGDLCLDDPARDYLPDFTVGRATAGDAPDGPVTIRQLLTHTAGLPAGRQFHRWCDTRADLLRDLYQVPLDAPPGTRVVYSDLGFLLLGELAAAVAREPLDRTFGRLVAAPLGLTATGFNPAGPPDRFAATEPRGDGLPWTGVVHDENARLLGGVAGHAGLFAPAADLAAYAAWWMSGSDLAVPAALRRRAATVQTEGLGGRRGLGWAARGDAFDVLDEAWPPTAVSHTGFTGTSLALDPVSGWWVVLLTNAVHAGREFSAIRALRRGVHATLARAILS